MVERLLDKWDSFIAWLRYHRWKRTCARFGCDPSGTFCGMCKRCGRATVQVQVRMVPFKVPDHSQTFRAFGPEDMALMEKAFFPFDDSELRGADIINKATQS